MISLPNNPIEAARGAARPAARSRFYRVAATLPVAGGYTVQLDDKPLRTPSGRVLVAPAPALAEAIAAEWNAQRDVIDLSTMPLTRLANTIVDGVAERPQPVAAEVAKYIASDLLFYRAETPAALAERQRRCWDPVLGWARQTLGAEFKLGRGVMHVAQSDGALAAARAAIPADCWKLGAIHVVTTLTGSALIALALAGGFLSADDAWLAAHVDEDWNMEQWGRDELELERRNFRHAEFKAAAALLGLV